jgi:hypothetical protein
MSGSSPPNRLRAYPTWDGSSEGRSKGVEIAYRKPNAMNREIALAAPRTVTRFRKMFERAKRGNLEPYKGFRNSSQFIRYAGLATRV